MVLLGPLRPLKERCWIRDECKTNREISLCRKGTISYKPTWRTTYATTTQEKLSLPWTMIATNVQWRALLVFPIVFNALFDDRVHYKHRPDLTVEKAAATKRCLAKQLLSDSWTRNLQLLSEHVPVVRLTRKSKCMDKTAAGISYTKAHSRDREIINCAAEPLKPKLRFHAKALRMRQRIWDGDRKTLTLWNQSKVADEVLRTFSSLGTFLQYARRCPCGQTKYNTTNVCKVDAAQFFKAASPVRAYLHCVTVAREISRNGKFDSIAVHCTIRGFAHLALFSAKDRKREFHMVKLVDIRATMSYAQRDNFFRVGNGILQRETGHPMCGTFSEPATCVGLGGCSLQSFTRTLDSKKVWVVPSGSGGTSTPGWSPTRE